MSRIVTSSKDRVENKASAAVKIAFLVFSARALCLFVIGYVTPEAPCVRPVGIQSRRKVSGFPGGRTRTAGSNQ